MGSLSPSIVEKRRRSRYLPSKTVQSCATAVRQGLKAFTMRSCRISFEALPLARPAHRLTACRIDGMPVQYPRLAVEAQQPLPA